MRLLRALGRHADTLYVGMLAGPFLTLGVLLGHLSGRTRPHGTRQELTYRT